jgi:hypothetical protein
MKSHLSALTVTALLLTGCASNTPESKPEYDAVELALYQSCVDTYMKQSIEPQYRILGGGSPDVIRRVNGLCDPFKPVKK